MHGPQSVKCIELVKKIQTRPNLPPFFVLCFSDFAFTFLWNIRSHWGLRATAKILLSYV